MNLEKILPKNGPSINEVKKYIEKYLNEIIVIKCGGSVLLEENLFKQFIDTYYYLLFSWFFAIKSRANFK